VNLRDRSSNHLVTHIDHLRESIRVTKQHRPFEIIAFVALPDHLHTVLRFPENDSDYPARWKAIKSCFSRAMKREGIELKKNKKGELNLW
jgi:putative transposase